MPWIDIRKPVGDDEPNEREKQQVEDFARRKAKPRFYADENFPQLATSAGPINCHGQNVTDNDRAEEI
jgi:hypothetical protein